MSGTIAELRRRAGLSESERSVSVYDMMFLISEMARVIEGGVRPYENPEALVKRAHEVVRYLEAKGALDLRRVPGPLWRGPQPSAEIIPFPKK